MRRVRIRKTGMMRITNQANERNRDKVTHDL